jgi:hypothetical protein
VKKHLAYLNYVLRHKWFVFLAGRERGVGLWQLIVHDWSKFLPDEWGPYAEWFYGYRGGSWHKALDPTTGYEEAGREERKRAFERAFLLHLHRNPHHHQFWTLPGYGDKPATTFEMPAKYRREMLADWDGAGRAISGKNDTLGWYGKNRGALTLHPTTQREVEAALGIAA